MESTASHMIPLLRTDSDTPLMWQAGKPVSRRRFAAAAAALAERLPPGERTLNLCQTRFGFCAALVASVLRGQVCVLPGTQQQRAALQAAGQDATLLTEDPSNAGITVPRAAANNDEIGELPEVTANQPAAIVFTSGSTGAPRVHVKTCISLLHSGIRIAQRLLPTDTCVQIVATVPMHHMYGLETSVALPLVTPHSVLDGIPVFPEDVRRALASVPAPRALITTPVHLRALINAATRLPPLVRIISATAPLPVELAAHAEALFGAPVHEIYGCTEAGSVASRRSVDGARWQPLAGMQVGHHGQVAWVTAPHLAGEVVLHDVLETDAQGGFRLLGRDGDLVKVAGKRASLASLTHQLLSIPGVVDGIVTQPRGEDRDPLLNRTAALVVAPELTEIQVLTALSRLIDPVFLPRPLHKVDALPRNATGKLRRVDIERLLTHA
ncbi:MAG TPA: AMP-binding protein [Nevskiaceae bacterium]|nr:AMP-binding protein [Nevskiaceae bacterium]